MSKSMNWTPRFEPVDDNPYLADFYKDMQRWSFNLQIYFLNKRFKEVVNIRRSNGNVIQDRTIYEDSCVFAPNLHKMGLMLINGIGIGDSDYCGSDDEYRAAVYNFSKKTVLVKKAERVVQMLVLRREKVEWEELAEFSKKNNRGGFGSTGKK